MPKKLIYEKLEKRIQELEQAESKYKRNERALQEGLDKYRAIIDEIPLLICSFLPGGEISLVNSAYCDYFGKTLDELVGSNFLSLIPDADQKAVMDNISDAVFITDDTGVFTFICPNVSILFGYSYEEVSDLGNIENLLGINLFDLDKFGSSREVKNIECVIQDKSGMAHILLVNVKLVSIKGGTVLYTCRDITEHKRAEEALQESEEKTLIQQLQTSSGILKRNF